MAVDPDRALVEHYKAELSDATRSLSKLQAEHETLKSQQTDLLKQIEGLKARGKGLFSENRSLTKLLHHRSVVVPESFYNDLQSRVEWAEYLEDACNRSLIIVLSDKKLEDRLEAAINLMLGLDMGPVEVESDEEGGPDNLPLDEEDREEMARIYDLDVLDFTTKNECLALVAERGR